jgi:hypothetical protein
MDEINIKYPTRKFDFAKLTLTYPKSIASGSYFTKILHTQSALYLQIPKCITKNGLVKSSKKMTCELLLDNMNEELVGWFENLDNRCKELLQQNSEEWFGNTISSEDIDNAFGTTTRLYKSGKFSLVKTNIKVNQSTDTPMLSVYDENQKQQPVESITNETNIVAILEISGIRFTSRSFNLEIDIKQIMTVDEAYEEDICFNRCMIIPRVKTENAPVPSPEQKREPDVCVEEEKEKSICPLSTKVEILGDDENKENPITEPEPEPELTTTQNIEPMDTAIELEENEMDSGEMKEIDDLEELPMEEMTLNKPEEIYYELYRKTKQKAKEALLEAKRIKEQYQLDVSDWETSDEEDEEDD